MNRRAFTLVEVIAAVVILAVIGTIASQTILTAMDGYIRGSTQAQLHSELSTTLDRIERELRKIPIKVGHDSIAPDITAINASSITWTGGYALNLSGGQLMWADNGAASSILLDNVTGFTVQGYDEANVATNSIDLIRRISITITMQRSGITETLRTKVFLRNTLDGASP